MMPDWDEIFSRSGRVFTEPHPDMVRIADYFGDEGVQRILDLGCGTGRHLLFFGKLGFEMHGFDASSTALSLANEWLDQKGIVAETLQHRMEEMFPYPTDFFDAIISIQVIHHNLKHDILTTVKEIERVLRPGGVIFITFPIHSPAPESPEDDWDLRQVEPDTYIPQKGPEAGIPHHYFTLEEIPEVFHSFEILDLYVDEVDHRCLLGRIH
ncbi:MAG: class I SAM-dependent methyltransferase [Candidatus Thorarchaeota archaeon]|nr:MAG: class I SAM-dependent methyltransferase [Candidatus Thorarchaeota archaeon]